MKVRLRDMILICFLLLGGQMEATLAHELHYADMTTQQLRVRAQEFESSGILLSAASVYEELLARDPPYRQVLVSRLAVLYAEAGDAKSALQWAREAARNNPEPEAYLAGIYSLLGEYERAREILEQVVQAPTTPERRVSHYWQLAEVCEVLGDHDAAGAYLQLAVDVSQGNAQRRAAKNRLHKYRGRSDALSQ
jgi:tetratricopeptide (TPR) repeat protein